MTQIIVVEADKAEAVQPAEAFEPFYSGEEFALHYGYYASDDEVVEDDPLDAVAFAYWQQQMVDDAD